MLDTKLYTLIKVAELGNFTRASEALGLTQPAVSQHIKALEEHYGVRLFGRSGLKLVITKEGEKVLAAAKAMLAINNNLMSELSGVDYGVHELSIGITHTMESNLIAQILTRYASENDVTIKLITDTQPALFSGIKNYELDVAVVDGAVTDPDLMSLTLDTDSLVLIADPQHRFASRSSIGLDDIKKEKLILRLPTSSTSSLFKSSLESRGMSLGEFDVILEVDNIATIKNLVRQGYGVSVLARSACMDELRKGKLSALPIEGMSMYRELNIVYSKEFMYKDFLKSIEAFYHEASSYLS